MRRRPLALVLDVLLLLVGALPGIAPHCATDVEGEVPLPLRLPRQWPIPLVGIGLLALVGGRPWLRRPERRPPAVPAVRAAGTHTGAAPGPPAAAARAGPAATRVKCAPAPVPARAKARWRGVNTPIDAMDSALHGPAGIRSSLGRGVLSVSLAGEFDHYGCLPLRALLDEGAALGARLLVLDAARVTFCDSALGHVLERWSRDGRSWELASCSRSVRLLLDLWDRVGRPAGAASGTGARR